MYDKQLIFKRYPALLPIKEDMEKALELLRNTVKSDGTVYVCGNGGSAADSEHIVGELMKGFLKKRPMDPKLKKEWEDRFGTNDREITESLQMGIKAVSLPSQCAVNTAFLNDCLPDALYAQLAFSYTGKNDLLICISTSGNSKNTVLAAKAAKIKGAAVISFTGEKQSELSAISDVTLKVPATETYMVQEYHLPVYHWLCAAIEDETFKR